MDKIKIEKDYNKYKKYYQKFQQEIYNFVFDFLEEFKNIDIAEIKQRPYNKIKELNSILVNIDRSDKYVSCSSIFDIKDLAGVRIICHCEDDLNSCSEIIENKLREKKFLDIDVEHKGFGFKDGADKQKSRPSYRAIHLTFSKKINSENNNDVKIFCEIQLRTVMADAWAVQDRKYIYGQKVEEGDRHILTDAVSEIMKGCEALWSLVKTKYKNGSLKQGKDLKVIRDVISKNTEEIKQINSKKFNEDLEEDKLL